MSMVSKKDIVRHMTDVLNFKNVIIYQDGWDDSVCNCMFWIKKLFFRLKTIAVKLKKSSQYLKNCTSMFHYLDFIFLQNCHKNNKQRSTVKSFNFVCTKSRGLTLDMFVDTWICGFPIICIITKVNNYHVGTINLWIALPTTYTKLNIQRI